MFDPCKLSVTPRRHGTRAERDAAAGRAAGRPRREPRRGRDRDGGPAAQGQAAGPGRGGAVDRRSLWADAQFPVRPAAPAGRGERVPGERSGQQPPPQPAADAAALRRQSAGPICVRRNSCGSPIISCSFSSNGREGKFINEIERGLARQEDLQPLPALSDHAAQDRTRARSRRADERARRRLLSGRRGRLDHAQSLGLLGAVSDQGRPRACRISSRSAATAIQFHAADLASYTFNVENPLSQDNDFATGLQPGDLTKSMALPWQADFNECTTNPINVTYADWNVISPEQRRRPAADRGGDDLGDPVVAGAPAAVAGLRTRTGFRSIGAMAFRRPMPAISGW